MRERDKEQQCTEVDGGKGRWEFRSEIKIEKVGGIRV